MPPASIATTLAAGSAALRQHDYWGAEQLFLQVIKRDPSQVAAYYDLGLAYQDRHDYRDALRAYAKAQEVIEQLQEALQSRDVIGQAKGIIQAREGCGPDEAFERLRSMSQHRNIKLRDLAKAVVEAPDDNLRG